MKKIGIIIAFLIVISLFLVPLTACEEKVDLTDIEIPAGAQGPQGERGPQGPTGPAGEAGEAGPAGEDGSMWYAGSDAPAAATGVNGDFYLNKATGDVFQKVNGAWTYVTNLEGPRGLKGPMGPQGPAGPSAQIVVVEDAQPTDPRYAICLVVATAAAPTTVHVYGSNFIPGDYIHITICENDILLTEEPTTLQVNACGAFHVAVLLNDDAMLGVDSVKAYVDDGDFVFDPGDIRWACWPLEVISGE